MATQLLPVAKTMTVREGEYLVYTGSRVVGVLSADQHKALIGGGEILNSAPIVLNRVDRRIGDLGNFFAVQGFKHLTRRQGREEYRDDRREEAPAPIPERLVNTIPAKTSRPNGIQQSVPRDQSAIDKSCEEIYAALELANDWTSPKQVAEMVLGRSGKGLARRDYDLVSHDLARLVSSKRVDKARVGGGQHRSAWAYRVAKGNRVEKS